MFSENAGMTWDEACTKALLHVPAIKKNYPHYLEEMTGIANGAGVAFEDILALNTRSEIALLTSPDGCTSFALSKPKTKKTWLAQNWDWKESQADSIIHLEIQQSSLPTIEMITEAGIIGKIGCNSAGIGVCLNALKTNQWQPKLPIHLGLRAILDSRTFDEAISKVDDNQIASAAHFFIASNSEELVSMEVSPVHTAKIRPRFGMFQHTNHICSEPMKQDMDEITKPDSYQRLHTAVKLLDTHQTGQINQATLFHWLADHQNYPNSICRHNDPNQAEPDKVETVFSIVMNLSDHQLDWVKGKPCEFDKFK